MPYYNNLKLKRLISGWRNFFVAALALSFYGTLKLAIYSCYVHPISKHIYTYSIVVGSSHGYL